MFKKQLLNGSQNLLENRICMLKVNHNLFYLFAISSVTNTTLFGLNWGKFETSEKEQRPSIKCKNC